MTLQERIDELMLLIFKNTPITELEGLIVSLEIKCGTPALNTVSEKQHLTLLQYAILHQKVAITELLLKHEADPNFKNPGSPLPITMCHSKELQILLQQYGAKFPDKPPITYITTQVIKAPHHEEEIIYTIPPAFHTLYIQRKPPSTFEKLSSTAFNLYDSAFKAIWCNSIITAIKNFCSKCVETVKHAIGY